MDGHTAVIGGIYTRNTGRTSTRCRSSATSRSWASLPATAEEDDRTELLVFITPRIANRNELLRADALGTMSPLAPPPPR